MTVLIRSGSQAPGDEITPSVPTLAGLTARLNCNGGLPICVDRETYVQAESEMVEVRRLRGFSWIETSTLPQRNFLLFGIPIVCED